MTSSCSSLSILLAFSWIYVGYSFQRQAAVFLGRRGRVSPLQAQQQRDQIPAVPSLEQLSNDPFMKQVQHGAVLSQWLCNDFDETDKMDNSHTPIRKALETQLSHSDGIRGFMVAYLTAETLTDQEVVPPLLLQVLKDLLHDGNDDNPLISLVCMNMIMPTAMMTMHETEELRESSRVTAKRGAGIVTALINDSMVLRNNVEAIKLAALPRDENQQRDSQLLQYWIEFFEKWGYKDEQLNDIEEIAVQTLRNEKESSSNT